MKLYTTTVFIAGPPITDRNFAAIAGSMLGLLCYVGWHVGRTVTLPPEDGEIHDG